MASRILVLHGPNLNLLVDLEDIDGQLEKRGKQMNLEVKSFQANSEGTLVDALHAERTKLSGIIVNAARLAPNAVVLAEAIGLVGRPCIEVLFDLRDAKTSALKPAVTEQVIGKGVDGYLHALQVLSSSLHSLASRPTGAIEAAPPANGKPSATLTGDESETSPVDQSKVKKALGRRNAETRTSTGSVKKTIGRVPAAMPSEETVMGTSSLSRAMVRDKIGERLSGRLTPAGLATWARGQWQQLQRGAPVEAGQRDRLEDVLQTLLLSASSKANDHQLIELMTQLG
jgi:3-dehydroquinate dehydratase-2